MNMLTDREVDHIAKLSRIELDDALRTRMKKDLSSILGYVEQLEKVDTAGTEPLYQVTGLQNQARSDEHKGTWPMTAELADLLVGQAPHHHDGYVKVKSVKSK
ncbi:MAG TPA: Asp-tRNA(Asn)/Glu-tRNA(Gln) amidotransferase subunit GatC [Candidatus Paceibacterota bacterium]|nr:Asp-tRNA(Asn)/Glu-tRNA(Gln) amidotransferase subunit GatC [Candidatus Paceibacterota bacterium]